MTESVFINTSYANQEEDLSISNCQLLSGQKKVGEDSSSSPNKFLVFGPKLSILNRKSIDSNYKLHHTDSLEELQKDHNRALTGEIKRPSAEVSDLHHLNITEKKRSNSNTNSLNVTKNNLHVETSEHNNSEGDSFLNLPNSDQEKDQTKAQDKYRRFRRHLENIYFNIFITLITIYALFASDIQSIFFGKESDVFFDAFNLFSMTIFFLEIVLSFVVKPNYKFSFFFWLDVVSTLSLLLDVTFVKDALLFE